MSERPTVDRVLHALPRATLSNATELDATWLSDLQRGTFPRAKPQVESGRNDHATSEPEWQDADQVAAYSGPGNLFIPTIEARDDPRRQAAMLGVIAVPQLQQIPAEPRNAHSQSEGRRDGDYREQPNRRVCATRTSDNAHTE